MNFAVGGNAGDVITAIRDYGIVPTEIYEGLNYGTQKPHFNEIDAVLKAYVDAIIAAPNKTLTTAWQNGLNGILDAYFGQMPETFTYRGKEYTPKSFAESLPIDLDDYVDLTSYTHHPFYESFILEIPDNWRWHSQYNLPLDEMMQVVDHALDNGYTIEWAADVSELGFDRIKAIGIIPRGRRGEHGGHRGGALGQTLGSRASEGSLQLREAYPREEHHSADAPDGIRQLSDYRRPRNADRRLRNRPDRQALLQGQELVGRTSPYDGYYYFSRPFVEYKTMSILVNKIRSPNP